MYSKTHTKGIILKAHELGEKDFFLSIFTRDLGHIYAKVNGARSLNSKHRYSIQEYSLSDFALIKSKTGWKITNVIFIKSFYFDITTHAEIKDCKREIIIKILSLVKRFYLGEDPDEKIFEDLLVGLEQINNSIDKHELEIKEAETLLCFLHDLGYIQKIDLNKKDSNYLRNMRIMINEGIRISGL